jgi:hypothetical protein
LPASVTVKPVALIIKSLLSVLPFGVTVEVPVIVKAPLHEVAVVVVDKVKLPAQAKVPVLVNVQVAPVVSKLAQFNAPVIVIVGEPELPLIITASVIVGTEAPPLPPEVVDQLVVEIDVQLPLPPTQYLLAI